MIRTRIEVRNMACEMCEAHVIEAVRKILSHGEARRRSLKASCANASGPSARRAIPRAPPPPKR